MNILNSEIYCDSHEIAPHRSSFMLNNSVSSIEHHKTFHKLGAVLGVGRHEQASPFCGQVILSNVNSVLFSPWKPTYVISDRLIPHVCHAVING